jgi:hypothetical protein
VEVWNTSGGTKQLRAKRFAVNEQNALQHAMLATSGLRAEKPVSRFPSAFASKSPPTNKFGGNDDAACFDKLPAAGLVRQFHVR